MSSVEEDDYDTLTDIDSDKNVIRTKVCYPHPTPAHRVLALGGSPIGLPASGGLTPASLQQYLYVADLARKDKRVLRKKYQIYFW